MSGIQRIDGREKLQQIRKRHDRANPAQIVYGPEGMQLAVISDEGIDPIFTFALTTAQDDKDFHGSSHEDMGFVLRQLVRLMDRIEQLYQKYPDERPTPPVDPKDFTTECAMLCNDQAFRRFLIEQKGMTDAPDTERVVTYLRKILNIVSRTELNTDKAAGQRWQDLRKDFKQWSRS